MRYNILGGKMKFENLLIAHRGIHDNIDIPENTLQAFKKAIKNKLFKGKCSKECYY